MADLTDQIITNGFTSTIDNNSESDFVIELCF